MDFTGASATRPSDRTQQATGVPLSRPTTHDEKPPSSPDSSNLSETQAKDGELGRDKELRATSDDSSATEFEPPEVQEHRRNSIVQCLARQYTQRSQAHAAETADGEGTDAGFNPAAFTSDDPNSPLNPNGNNFSGKAWAKAIANMVTSSGGSFRTSGVAFQNMGVYGFGHASDYQQNIGNIWLQGATIARSWMGSESRKVHILRNFDGVVRKGEMLVVLGPPGSGCTTTLKTISGEMNGIHATDETYFNYQGVSAKEMHTRHRGEAIYTAEVDAHFPQLTVGETLTFASKARAPRKLPEGVSKTAFSNHLRDVVMAMFGISHTMNTRVGNEYIRGVSGGERKRVTIAEAALSAAPLQCWDNSTRGLDSANAIEFCKTLRLQTELFNSTAIVSIYQAPQTAYDLFDKATVLYDGRQIYFGPASKAKEYFINLGFQCTDRATTPDFLTSMTAPQERIPRAGFENRVPRTADEFAQAWKNSAEYKALQADIEEFKEAHPIDGPDAQAFRANKRAMQAKSQRANSSYTLSFMQQIKLCLWRGWRRLVGDPTLTVGVFIGNAITALIISSVFYNLPQTSSSFYSRDALLFFACLMNAFSSALEILTLYSQRPIVEKHSRYALYHPAAEAVSSMICDLPAKVLSAISFNVILYFMTNLRREVGPFFFYLLINFTIVLVMSMIFRTIASSTRTLSQAMVPAAVVILILVVFTGFVVPTDYMLGWCRWLNYLDPLTYAFEALMVNEFHNRNYTCTEYFPSASVPGYENLGPANRICTSIGATPGSDVVAGDAYVNTAFRYYFEHRWRNFGIMIGFIFFFLAVYMIAAELVSEKQSKGEVLLFPRGHKPAPLKQAKTEDAERGPAASGPVVEAAKKTVNDSDSGIIEAQTAVFHWENVCYDVKIKKETRRILDHVDGWVKPGTLTALMGVSGAGKTTLLDCLADRTSMGVIYGDMFVDGHERDNSFQRKTGYVQQQDLHLQTTTVREALNFSALLRQPGHISKKEKLAYVDEVIKLLDMQEYAEAVVGVPGEGLNVEQRKRLTIGVELVAKPPLLLFVDEPTSGLDSQTSWAILDLLEKLTKSGQAILCTIHQPSAMLFQRFDRLLFLQKGGQTVYFGDIGEGSGTMTSYFERISGTTIPVGANPAEWMLEIIGAAPGTKSSIDWFQAWRDSPECADVKDELTRLRSNPVELTGEMDNGSYREFAAGFWTQLVEVSHRVFQQYWRTPSYIYSKAMLCIFVGLFIGFVFFKAPNTQTGLQNQMFAIFQLLTVFGQLVQQTMPHFVVQRSLYEVRERPSKVYGWKVFMLSQIIAELPWNTLMSVLMFFCWYYPVGYYNNAREAGASSERAGLMFLFLWMFLIFTSTFTDFCIAGLDTAEAGGNMANTLFMLCLLFSGVLAGPGQFPHFWIFMYRVSPFNYLVSGMMSTGVANVRVTCADVEYLPIAPPNGQTCQQWLGDYISVAGGYLTPESENSTSMCQYCTISETNTYLAARGVYYNDRWRNFGILFAYVIFNIFAALAIYWIARVPKNKIGRKKSADDMSRTTSRVSRIMSRASKSSKTKGEKSEPGPSSSS